VALLRPRLHPLSSEQRAEATALLCDLLLTAARRAGGGGSSVPAAGGERREDELAA
jgi:hypothetical protein